MVAEQVNQSDNGPDARPWAAGRHAPRKTRAAATHALGAAALLLSFLGGMQGAQLPPGYRACTSYATHAPDLRILPSRPQLSCTPPRTSPRAPPQVSTVGNSQSSG